MSEEKGAEGTTLRLRETITKNLQLQAEVLRIENHTAPRSGEPNEERLIHIFFQRANTAIDKRRNHYAGMPR